MLEYVILFVFMIILAIPLCITPRLKNIGNETDSKVIKRNNIIYLGIVFTVFYLLSIFRYGIGNDYFSYYDIFMQCKNASDIGTLLSTGIEPAFALLNKAISFLTDDIRIIYGIYGLCILVPAGIAIYKYSRNVWMSCIIYVSFTFFYASLSFIRQSIAASIILLAFSFVKNKKILPVILLSLLAACFHFTSLIFLPFFFLSFIKPSTKYFIIYGIVTVTVYVTYQILLNVIGINPLDIVANIASKVFGRDFSSYIGTIYFNVGFEWVYVIMPALMLAFLLIAYYKGWGKNNPEEVRVYINFMLYTFTFWLLSTIIFILERFSMYMFIYIVLAVPSILEHYMDVQKEKYKSINTKKKSSNILLKNSYYTYLGIAGTAIAGSLAYNVFGMTQNYHGDFPYMSMFPQIEQTKYDTLNMQDRYTRLINTRTIYETILLADCDYYDYIITGRASDYKKLDPVTIKALEYCGIDTSLLENENSNFYVYCKSGEIVTQICEPNEITDQVSAGKNNVLTVNIPAPEETGYAEVYSQTDEMNCTLPLNGINIMVFANNETGQLLATLNVDVSSDYRMQATKPTYS